MMSTHYTPGIPDYRDNWMTNPAIEPNSGASDLVEGYKHLRTALVDFRTQVSVVSKEHYFACASFSMNVVVVNIDNARRASTADFQALVVEPIKALRITLTMRQMTRQHLLENADSIRDLRKLSESKRSPLAGRKKLASDETFVHLEYLLRKLERHTGQVVATLQTKSEDYSSFVQDLSCSDPPSEGGADTRLMAAVALKALVQQSGGFPGEWGDLCSWPWCLSGEFMALLAAKDEAALVITIYWFVVMSRISSRWYLNGWAQRAVIASLRHVGPGWNDVLAWPKSQLGLDAVAIAWRGPPVSSTSTPRVVEINYRA